jgi:ubiquinone/menaquinone biosynthesis C-methylase UbiE
MDPSLIPIPICSKQSAVLQEACNRFRHVREVLAMRDSIERFGDRADEYAKFRPGYPAPMLRFLRDVVSPPAVVADIGSGTGILTGQLLDKGYELYAVEPNGPMRSQAESTLGDRPRFHSVRGRAEATTLPDRAVDLITCAQAFHWFDRVKAKLEFCRILKGNGRVAIVWNERLENASEINRKYDDILRRMAPEYSNVNHRKVSLEDIEAFFAEGEVQLCTFPNEQVLDRRGFLGRLLSCSYVPNVGQPGHHEIVDAVSHIFDEYEIKGKVTFVYETRLYLGQFNTGSLRRRGQEG